MPFFGFVWTTSWVSYFLASSQGIFKVPDPLSMPFPESVLSVASSPVEKPTAHFLPMPFNGGVESYRRNAIALPKLALLTDLTTFPLTTQPAQISWHPKLQQDAGAADFCTPESPSKKDSQPVGETSIAAFPQTSHDRVSKGNLPQQILRVMQNLFSWHHRVEPEAKTSKEFVVVVSTHPEEKISDKNNSKEQPLKHGLWRYSKMLKNALETAPSSAKKEQFQVLVKGRLIAQLPTRQEAEQIAQNIKNLLCNSNSKAPSIEARMIDGVPVVKAGDRVLFAIDKNRAKKLNNKPEILAIEWMNNLRIALGESPLQLVDAQKQLYNLVETSNKVEGRASWYGPYFNGRLTANGEIYNEDELTAAHPSLPFNTYLKVKNLNNGNTVIVRVNDRGPYIPGRNLDLSRQAARSINSEQVGVVPFEATIMKPSSSKSTHPTKN
jgi:rare lipoprotein A